MKPEVAQQIKEETTQVRLALGEKLGQMPPDVQLKVNQALDALERIDRLAQHGVGAGESPRPQAPGVPGDGLKRPSDTDVKADADEKPKASKR